jgi:hypothetical protein
MRRSIKETGSDRKSNMKIFPASLLIILFCQLFAWAQRSPLPALLEIKTVTPARTMQLWMREPSKHPREEAEDEIYTCPDQTRGSYYTGAVSVTLLDAKTGTVLSTLEVKGWDTPEIDLPYAIRPGFYYKVISTNKNKESKPQIMALKDYNGDGKAYEFALFDAPACMGLGTTLIGYSAKADKIIQYPITLRSSSGSETIYWADYLFWQKAVKPGFWRYEIDYRGRGGTLDKYEFSYNKQTESFSGTVTQIE